MPCVGNHHDLSRPFTNGTSRPGGLDHGVLPVGVLLSHDHEGGTVHLVQPGGDDAVVGASRGPEGAPAPRAAQQVHQARGSLPSVGQSRPQPGRVAVPHSRTPRAHQRDPKHGALHESLDSTLRPTQKGADEDEPAHQVGAAPGCDHRSSPGHGGSYDDGGAGVESLDQGNEVGCCGLVTIGGEGCRAVPVTAQVRSDNAEARLVQGLRQRCVDVPHVPHGR